MSVYIDILIFDNMLLNCVIIFAVSGYMKKTKRVFWKILSAAIGTLYSVLMVFFEDSFLGNWFLKFILSAVMVYVAYFPESLGEFLKLLLCFYIVSFIFAGLAIALIFLWGQTPTTYNGVVYFSWSSPVKYILVVAIAGFWFVKLFLKTMQKRKIAQSKIIDLHIGINNSVCVVPALIDTGNELKDAVTGSPIIVAELSKMKKILPESFVDALENDKSGFWNSIGDVVTGTDLAGRFRLVPFRSLGCEHGLMPGLKADYIATFEDVSKKETFRFENVIVCISLQCLSPEGNYFALMGTDFDINK